MPRIQLKINAAASQDQLATASTEFPEEEFEILASHTIDDRLVGILKVRTMDGDAIVQYFQDTVGVYSSEVLFTDERYILLQYEIPIPDPYRVARASGNLTLFPITMHDGWLFVERSASNKQLAQYRDQLESAGLQYQILSLQQSHDPIELLTDRQRQFITEAIARGYYETPRQCTLTDLAEIFGINKSAASETLRRAEGRIITDALPKAKT
ncbi:helix-turn-helix domain-containing protein [Haladaptatus sp. DYF46]|uniref:helix-turn-helix domain-containing protein n=1 Tax=Haladaptatus sp. DYF46 TaxID=2886041 RepID=UPI001E450A50|nr:helix-turn-helix domain-containing protein [Haladaptatus sp. DYF46]